MITIILPEWVVILFIGFVSVTLILTGVSVVLQIKLLSVRKQLDKQNDSLIKNQNKLISMSKGQTDVF